jgi:guanidinopropionase
MSKDTKQPTSFEAQRRPRFSEIATFMRAPLAESLDDLDIAMIGVPMDLGVTNRAGARHGPREIRNASSMMRNWNPSTNIEPFGLAKVADVGDVPIDNLFNLDEAIRQIEAYYIDLHNAGVVPLSAGGDHSITYPIMQAIGASEPVGMVHIDAHLDTWGEFYGSKFHHGAPFRLAVEAGVLDPQRCIQIGIRGGQNTLEGFEFSRGHGMRVVTMDEFTDIGVEAVIAEARKIVGDGPTYITFDVDGLDPVYAPGTGTPEIAGITTVDALRLLRGLRGLNLIGGDVVEVAPPFDQTGNTALVGATLMWEILCLLAEAVHDRR